MAGFVSAMASFLRTRPIPAQTSTLSRFIIFLQESIRLWHMKNFT